jgi:hypothetical protein
MRPQKQAAEKAAQNFAMHVGLLLTAVVRKKSDFTLPAIKVNSWPCKPYGGTLDFEISKKTFVKSSKREMFRRCRMGTQPRAFSSSRACAESAE